MGLPVVTLVSPTNLVNSDLPVVHFDAKYTDTVNSLIAGSVIYEVDTVNTFNSPNLKIVTYTNVSNNTTLKYIVTLFNTTWYWRVTATNADGTTVSSIYSLTVAQIMKRALYQYENIAKYGPDWQKKRALYQYENIAKYGPDWTKKRALYEYENITSDPPFPWIESLSTIRAAAGSIVTITGNGFGYKYDIDTANADRFLRGYGGYVYINSMICNIISWSWTKIVFQLPADAESGPVKVQLTSPTVRDSNVIGFEVLSMAADSVGLEFFICDRTNPNTILAQLDGAKNKAFQALLNNPGSGQFSISRYDPKGSNRDYIKDQNYILCRLDGIDVFKWIIEGRRPNYVDTSEQQMIEISGRGVLAMLNWAVVYPENIAEPILERKFTGMSGAKILRTLILEAQARGGLVGLSVEWTDTEDSIGNPISDVTNISFHVGTPLLAVAKKFSEGLGLFDIEMTPELKLKLYASKGDDKYDKVKYRPGQAIASHQNQSDSTNVVNTLLVEGENGKLALAAHSTSQNDWGRREGYLQASNITDGLSEYGQLYLNKVAYAYWGIQGSVIEYIDEKGRKLKPFESFLIGDWIGWYIPPEGNDEVGFDGKLRVKGITCDEDSDTGYITYTLELNNIMLENEIKMAQSVERLSMYSGNDVLSTPVQEVQPTKQVDTLPTANENYRGKIYVLCGSAGVADVSYICMKNAADTYEWVAI